MSKLLLLVSADQDAGKFELAEAATCEEMAETQWRDEWTDDFVGAYLHRMPVLGVPSTARNVWVCIGRYHEFALEREEVCDDTIENDISAVIFADSLDQVKQLLKTHPAYLSDLEHIRADDAERARQAAETDVLEFIWGDNASQLSQLRGDLVQVPQEYCAKIREHLLSQ